MEILRHGPVGQEFTFGLWTVGYNGTDPFGGPTRHPLDVVHVVEKLAEYGAYDLTFHDDDDLFAFGSTDAERRNQIDRLEGGYAATGLKVPMITTNLFSAPVFKDGGFTSNDREVRRFALRKVLRNLDLAQRGGCEDLRDVGRPRGRRVRPGQGHPFGSGALPRAVNLLAQYVLDQGYDLKFAIEPKPNEPRGRHLLPTLGHALAFIETLEHPELVWSEPRGRARADGLD